MINKWANFLMNEKLTPKRVGPNDGMKLVQLAEELSKKESPVFRPYKRRLESRRLVVNTAMDLSIDLSKMKHRGKMAMARSLLDIWNQVYEQRFGSIVGTKGEKEASRRNIRTSLGKQKLPI